MAEIVSKPATNAYRDNWDKAFTKVTVDKIAHLIIMQAHRGNQVIHEFKLTEIELLAANSSAEAVEPFWAHIPGLTPQEGYALLVEVLRERTHQYNNDTLAAEVERWESGAIKPSDPDWQDVDPVTGKTLDEYEVWVRRARDGRKAEDALKHEPKAFCLKYGHVRSVAYQGPRFVCLVCRGMYDRDPAHGEEIFISATKELRCCCDSAEFKETDLMDRGRHLLKCVHCGTLCVP